MRYRVHKLPRKSENPCNMPYEYAFLWWELYDTDQILSPGNINFYLHKSVDTIYSHIASTSVGRSPYPKGEETPRFCDNKFYWLSTHRFDLTSSHFGYNRTIPHSQN
jgi:hypothetical protein